MVLASLGLVTLIRESHSSCTDSCVTRWQIAFGAILLLEGLVFGHLPYLLKRFTTSSSRLATVQFHANAISAGIFLAAGMLHVFPESVELVAGDTEEEHHEEEGEHHEEEGKEGEEEHHEDEGHHHGGFPWAFFTAMAAFYVFLFIERVLVPRLIKRGREKLDTDMQSEEDPVKTASSPSGVGVADDEYGGEVSYSPGAGFRSTEFVVGLLSVVGLAAHSLFESIALGISESFSTSLSIFVAIAAHRWATTIALAFKLARKLNYWAFLTLLTLFVLAVPVGVGIGLGLSELTETARGILFSISAGTFLYIGAYEGVAETFDSDKKNWAGRGFLGMVTGAGIISIITAILVATDVH